MQPRPACPCQERTSWRLDLEAGATFQTKNGVHNPGNTGTQFNMTALQGDPTSPFFRATLAWDPLGAAWLPGRLPVSTQ